jgi:hypothetical protein
MVPPNKLGAGLLDNFKEGEASRDQMTYNEKPGVFQYG